MNKSLLLLVTLSLACGPPAAIHINPSPCSGCVDADGTCVSGNTELACGAMGSSCVACATGGLCSMGACVSPDGGVPPLLDSGTASDAGFDNCAAEAQLIYVLDQDRTLSSFDPRALAMGAEPLKDLGRISCSAKTAAEPFSMAVDRSAVAWIIYDSGEFFTVDLKANPLTCLATTFLPQQNIAHFGMGFVSNDAGSPDETLFVAGSEAGSSLLTTKFGTLSTKPPFALSLRGVLQGAPELSGSGDGKLWAFFPNVTPPKVAELDKRTGMPLMHVNVTALAGNPRAWAFAFWGGDFFMFLERDVDLATNVWKLDGKTGVVTKVLTTSTRHVVGAGVSTCAPIDIN